MSELILALGLKFSGMQRMQAVTENGERTYLVEMTGRERIEVNVVSGLSFNEATELMDKRIRFFRETFAGDESSGLGACPPQFGVFNRKSKLLNRSVDVLLGAATQEHEFGACSRSRAANKGALIIYFDHLSNSLWTWRIFSPWQGRTELSGPWIDRVLSRIYREAT